MSLNFCDLLIIGSDLSGLLAGTLLAKRGLSVLVLEDEDHALAEPNVLAGLDSRLFKSILGKLTIPEGRLKILKKNDVAYQIVLPKSRFNISEKPSAFFREIQREFPAQMAFFEKLNSDVDLFRKQSLETLTPLLPITDKKEKKLFVKLVKSLSHTELDSLISQGDPEIKAFLLAQLQLLSQGGILTPLFFQLFFLLSSESFATYSIEGGPGALKQLLFEKIEYFGGSIQKAQEGYELVVKKREVKGVKLAQCRYITRCRYVLGNNKIQDFYRLVPKGWRTHWARKKAAKLSPEGSEFTVLYVIDSAKLPSPMKENLLLISEPAQALQGLNYLRINIQKKPSHIEGAGDTLLSVVYQLPIKDIEKTVSEFEALHEAITQKLLKLIPFSESSLKRVFPKISLEDDCLFPESSEDYALFRKEAQRRLWYTPSFFYPELGSPYQNLFTVGPSVLSWLGVEGKVMAAMKAVDLIWGQEIKSRNP